MVCALDGGNTFRQRLVSQAAIRGSANDTAEIDVAGSRQHINAVLTALVGWSAGDNPGIGLEDFLHDTVRVFFVIAVFGRVEQQLGAESLMSFKVVVKNFKEFRQCQFLIVIDMIL